MYLIQDFYITLVEQTSTKYNTNQISNIIFEILTDACRLSSLLVSEIYKAISNLGHDEKLDFLSKNLKLIQRFIKMFRVVMRYSDICFNVLNFFGHKVKFTKILYLIFNVKFFFLILRSSWISRKICSIS